MVFIVSTSKKDPSRGFIPFQSLHLDHLQGAEFSIWTSFKDFLDIEFECVVFSFRRQVVHLLTNISQCQTQEHVSKFYVQYWLLCHLVELF
jgi:hypothetical protein